MFSYTDDAIVTSSPTGRHLSTVIRRPAAIGPLDCGEHADQVCKVLNELDSKVKAARLSTVLKPGPVGGAYLGPFPVAPAGEQGAELEKQLDDATTKLCAAQMLLEQADKKIAVLERRIADYQNAATNRGN